MQESSILIRAEDLTRNYKEVQAVSELELSIREGELFGLVGPDGAGKTTTLRLLAGLLNITSGTLEVAGIDLVRDSEAVKPMIGYMAQQFSLYGELSVLENLNFFAEFYDIERSILKERTKQLLSFAGLSDFKNRRAAHLSGGMQKKLALACTLIHQPRILLLDEPTTGVDPISRREFWDILTELHIEGTTIIVSTPYMDEADRCSCVGLMYAGEMVVCADPRQIRKDMRGELIEMAPLDWQAALELVQGLKGVLEVQTYGEMLHILVDSAEKRLPKLQKAFKNAGLQYSSLRAAPARMEEAFISLIHQLEADRVD